MKSLTLLTSKDLEGFIHDDNLLEDELRDQGIPFHVKPWEEFEDEGEEIFIIRTTWNYTEHFDSFISKLSPIADRLWNPLPLVKWNANKKYLIELAEKGLPVLPIELAHDQESLERGMENLGGHDFIIKPVYGASAIGLVQFDASNPPTIDSEVILQKFYPEIKKGEISLVYFSNQFSHALKKTPKSGDIRVQEEYGGLITPYSPSKDELQKAEQILEHIPFPWLYARVDLIPGLGLIELECIEPSLYFRTDAQSPKNMTQAIRQLI